jgi:predicted O-methyltransferase YrrM
MRPIDVYESCFRECVCDMRDHLAYLRSVAKGNILEIGVRGGASTSALLLGVEENGGHLYSVDIMACCGDKFAGRSQWTFIHADSRDTELTSQLLCDNAAFPLDVLFIDGDHEYPVVTHDLNYYWHFLRSGALILMHDVEEPLLPGPRQALNEFLKEHPWKHEIRPSSHGLAIIEVPA